ncbi:MAG: hypothetical protein R6W68_16410 [Ignavibacteriaceae bacterium]
MEIIFIVILSILLIISIFAKGYIDNIVYKIIYVIALISIIYYAFIYPEKFYYALLAIMISLPVIVKKFKRV